MSHEREPPEASLLASWRLLRACYLKDLEEARAALNEGADPNRMVSKEESLGLARPTPPIPYYFLLATAPLSLAARRGCASLARELMLRGADPNAADARGAGPLHYAASSGDCETIRELLSAGARAEAVDAQGDGALAWAAYERLARPEAVALLIEIGASWGGIGEEAEQDAKEGHDSWDPSGQSSWRLDERVRALLLAASEKEQLSREIGRGEGKAPKAL